MVSIIDYGAIPDGIFDNTLAIQTAINENVKVLIPNFKFAVYNKITIPENHSLEGSETTDCIIIDKTPNGMTLFDMIGNGSSLKNLNIIGEPIIASIMVLSTTYKINMSDISGAIVQNIKFNTGASGIQLINSNFCKVSSITFQNMAGTAIKLQNSSSNVIRGVVASNICKFVIYVVGQSCLNSITNIVKNIDITKFPPIMVSNDLKIDVEAGRSGLECIGLTRTCQKNIVSNIVSIGSSDNGISISGTYNICSNIYIENAKQDGFHIYGSYNNCSNIVSIGCGFSGVGISPVISETILTTPIQNIINGVISLRNTKYGIEYKGTSAQNIMSSIVTESIWMTSCVAGSSNMFMDYNGDNFYLDNTNKKYSVCPTGLKNPVCEFILDQQTTQQSVKSDTLYPIQSVRRSKSSDIIQSDILLEKNIYGMIGSAYKLIHKVQTTMEGIYHWTQNGSGGSLWNYLKIDKNNGYIGLGDNGQPNTSPNTPFHSIGETTSRSFSIDKVLEITSDFNEILDHKNYGIVILNTPSPNVVSSIISTTKNYTTLLIVNNGLNWIIFKHNKDKIRLNGKQETILSTNSSIQFIKMKDGVWQQI